MHESGEIVFHALKTELRGTRAAACSIGRLISWREGDFFSAWSIHLHCGETCVMNPKGVRQHDISRARAQLHA